MIAIVGFDFEGPYSQVSDLDKKQGVYVILGRKISSDRWNVVDVGESTDVNARISNHDRESCWKRQGHDQLSCAVLYTPGLTKAQRTSIERKIREEYTPACGVV